MNSPLDLRRTPPQAPVNARASIVNRTHRVVREQALEMREKRDRTRSLWVPIGIFSILLPIICYAVWCVMDGYDLTPNGIPDASDQLLLLMLWSLPITVVLLGMAWFKRGRRNGEVRQ
jgi:hypothetical protein